MAVVSVRVGIPLNEPNVYRDQNGKPAGFFPDILNYIAQREDWAIDYISCTWDECIVQVENGNLDLMMDVAFSESRAKRLSFNKEIVLVDWARVYTKKGISIRSILDLDGKKVALVKGSNQVDHLKIDAQAFGILPTIIEVESFPAVFDLIEKIEADAGIVNRIFGAQQMKNFGLEETGFLLGPYKMMFITLKTADNALLSRIDKHLKELKKDTCSIYYTALERSLSPSKRPISPVLPLKGYKVSENL